MRALLKTAERAGVLQSVLDPPIPRDQKERSIQGTPQLLGTVAGGIGGAGLGVLAGQHTDHNSAGELLGLASAGAGAGGAIGGALGGTYGNKKLLDKRYDDGEEVPYDEREDQLKMKAHKGRSPIKPLGRFVK